MLYSTAEFYRQVGGDESKVSHHLSVIISCSDLLTFSTDHCKVEIHADIMFGLCSYSPASSLI